MIDKATYVHLPPDEDCPQPVDSGPIAAVVIIEISNWSDRWQRHVCKWLLDSHVHYVMIWGNSCADWHDRVDDEFIITHPTDDLSDTELVMTAWHDDETLDEVFWFARNAAHHPEYEFSDLLIVHLSVTRNEPEMLRRFDSAK